MQYYLYLNNILTLFVISSQSGDPYEIWLHLLVCRISAKTCSYIKTLGSNIFALSDSYFCSYFSQSQQYWKLLNEKLFNQADRRDGLCLLILVEAELIEKL